ncbi:release factor glutamine methyltransferase [Pseudomonas synxantha]|uniref:SAM-dependent methyltransferase n=1 Tax=Pseudomonas synxantha TaxID=47883 RepID=A0AAX3I4Z5_9PSED|nr:methyltransferase [Pseudomonas synxantha]AZE68125.1 hypothetical protein C4K01_3937 [Pseudomonas synxantha]SDU12897.1 release factor glutamine methyltransferase [Pseudomonas synxantha]VTQ96066.1 SAM-dependent methyltransferase [Pseudomonas synxantha]
MSAQVNLQSDSPNIDPQPKEDVSYSLYFGLGQSLTLLDHPEVFKVSAAGKAFGSLLTRRFGRQYADARFLDIGTGSGVHSLLLRRLGMKSVTATDISAQAIDVAKINEVANLGTEDVRFILSDLFDGMDPTTDAFDVILFNPPGWQTPSTEFLQALQHSESAQGLAIEAMFYGDRTLKRFFDEVPLFLKSGAKLIIGLNSLVGIPAVMQALCQKHDADYHIDWCLLGNPGLMSTR